MGYENPGTEEYEELVTEYYDLVRERGELEAEGADDGERYDELLAEVAALEGELAALLDSFDERDFAALFEAVDE